MGGRKHEAKGVEEKDEGPETCVLWHAYPHLVFMSQHLVHLPLPLSPALPYFPLPFPTHTGALQLRVGYPPLSGNARQSGRQALAFYAKPDVTHLMAFNAFHAGNWRCEGGGGEEGKEGGGKRAEGGEGTGQERAEERGRGGGARGRTRVSGYALHGI